MLVQFSVRNFKTFKEKTTLSMIASKDTSLDDTNVIDVPKFKLRLLKTAVIYGANASGKTKLLEAIGLMCRLMGKASQEGVGKLSELEPFRLSNETTSQASEFEIIFIHNGEMFRYGFEANRNAVLSEWLYHRPKTKEIEIYYRDVQDIKLHEREFPKGRLLVKEGMVRSDSLLLSIAAQFNDSLALKVLSCFEMLLMTSGLVNLGNREVSIWFSLFKEGHKENTLNFLKNADIGVAGIVLEQQLQVDSNGITTENIHKLRDAKVLLSHKQFDVDNNLLEEEVFFSLDKEESAGTQKLFSLSAIILMATSTGMTLAVDELDSKLHPNLVAKIVSLFHTKESTAQLIFNTHDTNLLGSGMFRRDQIWFTEKDRYGVAHLYPLTDFKKDKKNESLEENYIKGRYGAIPYLGDFDQLMKNTVLHANEE